MSFPAQKSRSEVIQGALAYEEDVSRCPLYEDGGARPLWNELNDICKRSWLKNPTPRGFEFATEKTREAHRRYNQGKSHARQGRTDLLGQCNAYDRGHRAHRD